MKKMILIVKPKITRTLAIKVQAISVLNLIKLRLKPLKVKNLKPSLAINPLNLKGLKNSLV